jgi:hypothetical protein
MKDERDEALKLLRRTLELREIGAEGPHKSDIRAFFVRLGEPVAMTRVARQQSLERAIVAFNPDTTEALELLASFSRALIDRYGDVRTPTCASASTMSKRRSARSRPSFCATGR